MAILKFLITLVLIYFLFKMLYQMIVPAPVREVIRNFRQAAKQMNGGQPSTRQEPQAKPEGSVTITNAERKAEQQQNLKSKGEYVDYEEID